MSMTLDQKKHLDRLILAFQTQARPKYEHGAEEHGGNLWDKGILFLLEQAIEENIDQFIYLNTMRDELLKIQHLLPLPKEIDRDKLKPLDINGLCEVCGERKGSGVWDDYASKFTCLDCLKKVK